MKRLLLIIGLGLISANLFAQSPTPPMTLRYGDLIPRSDKQYNIGHPGVMWNILFSDEAEFREIRTQIIEATSGTFSELSVSTITIGTIVGDKRYIEATIPSSGFLSGTADYDGETWTFSDAVNSEATSVYFQIPDNYDGDIGEMSILVGWMTSDSSLEGVRWRATVYGAPSGGSLSSLGWTAITSKNAGANTLNSSDWIDVTGLGDIGGYGIYIEVQRRGIHAGDTLTDDATMYYIQVKIPVVNE